MHGQQNMKKYIFMFESSNCLVSFSLMKKNEMPKKLYAFVILT